MLSPKSNSQKKSFFMQNEMLSKTANSQTSSIMLIRHVEEVRENEDIAKEDHVDILNLEVTTRSMAQKMYVVVCARSVMLVVVATLTGVR